MKKLTETVRRTKSERYNKEFVGTTRLGWLLNDARKMGSVAGGLKKDLFYKDPKDLIPINIPLSAHLNSLETVVSERDVIHGILGILDEAGEIATILHQYFTSQVQEAALLNNLKEELGDLLWFAEVLVQGMGGTLEDIATINAAKLKKRYPDRFDTSKALNRDVLAEQEAMKKASK